MAKSTKKSRRHKNTQGKEDQKPAFFSKSKKTTNSQQPFFQTKLTIGQPGDKYEKEADSVANTVVNQSTNKPAIQQKEISSIQRATLATPPEYEKLGTAEGKMEEDKMIQEMPAADGAKEEEPAIQQMHDPAEKEEPQAQLKEEEESMAQKKEEEPELAQTKEEDDQAQLKEEEEPTGAVQTKSTTANASTASNQVSQTIGQKKGRGAKLPDKTRSEMETAFGKDLSEVNIHTDSDSVEMNQELGAQAFTTGKDVFFNAGKFNPETSNGKRLLAHELTHVVQQNGNMIQKQSGSTTTPSPDEIKRKALLTEFISDWPSIPNEIKTKVFKAMKAFSLRQLRKMKKVGLKFREKGAIITCPEPKKKPAEEITKAFRVGRGGKANYNSDIRIIGLNNASNVSDIRHELAHAWDNVQRIKLRPLNLRKLCHTMFGLGKKPKDKFKSERSRVIKRAFAKYKRRIGRSGEAKRLFAFDNPSTREGYSLSTVKEFYAEGYSVFHGPHINKKARLLKFAPELYRYLNREAKRNGLPRPNKSVLHNIQIP